MRFVRYTVEDSTPQWGIVNNDNRITDIEGDVFTHYKVTPNVVDMDRVTILPPCEPTKIVCVGLNYSDHAKEMKLEKPADPVIFLKPVSALIPHMEDIIYPESSQRVDYEAELALVMKNTVKDISEDMVDINVLGYTCFNDVTARDLQAKDGQWTRAKSFDTFAPCGPYLVSNINPEKQPIRLYLNGELKQESNTSKLIFKIRRVVSFISKVMTLNRGDIISTGTPAGIGPMKRGDKVEVDIGNVGKLTNYVR
ncbi:MAG: fumarylacetoacetate hydrolase family protein [Spirochaetia bacterium]|nr:fumarylacetoacetate hydrolase family protein [Spirochaetia bacterium]